MAKRSKRLLLALICAFACACAPAGEPVAVETPAPPEIIGIAPKDASPTVKTPALVSTMEPDMRFEEDGDIYFSDAFAATFTAGAYNLDHTPRVLIYHTHAEEAFRTEADTAASDGDADVRKGKPGVTADPAATPPVAPTYRSEDPAETVVRLGVLLAGELTARGFTVFHDTTDVEKPSLATAYERSLLVMQRYDDIDLFIDLHRNAANVARAKDDVVTLDNKRVARMFFVVGTGLTATDASNELENWRENYALALALTEQLKSIDPGLVKPIRVKQKAYNQQAGLCLLAEIGHNANLLADAEHTIPYFADALAAVFVP